MDNNMPISIEVAYATPEKQLILVVEVPLGATLEMAINKSGILTHFPEIDLVRQKVGVFSKIKKLTDVLHTGDRLEIYRSLLIDPKEARRNRERANNKLRAKPPAK